MEPLSWQAVFAQAGRDSLLVLPEIMPALFGVVILLTDCFLPARQKSWHSFTALLGLAFSGASLGALAGISAQRVPAFGGSILTDPFSVFFGWLSLSTVALVVLFALRYLALAPESSAEIHALLLFAAAGMMFLACGDDLVVLFIALEILVVSLVMLMVLASGRKSAEGAAKLFLSVAVGSAILAYGFSILYGLAGSTNLEAIAAKCAATPVEAPLAYAALALVCAGLFVPLAIAPFHHWAQDCSAAALGPVAAFISIGAKIAVFALLLRLFLTVFWPMRAALAGILAVAGVLSIATGTLAALRQTRLKRWLAYSCLGQAGYVLLAFVGAAGAGAAQTLSLQAVAYYLFVFAFFGTGAFSIVILLQRKNATGDDLDDLSGFARRSPAVGLLVLLFLLSLAGVPPTAGFIGVLLVISSLVAAHHVALAFFAGGFVVPALYSSLRVVRVMWKPVNHGESVPVVSWAEKCALVAAAAVTFGAGIFPERLLHFAQYSILSALAR